MALNAHTTRDPDIVMAETSTAPRSMLKRGLEDEDGRGDEDGREEGQSDFLPSKYRIIENPDTARKLVNVKAELRAHQSKVSSLEASLGQANAELRAEQESKRRAEQRLDQITQTLSGDEHTARLNLTELQDQLAECRTQYRKQIEKLTMDQEVEIHSLQLTNTLLKTELNVDKFAELDSNNKALKGELEQLQDKFSRTSTSLESQKNINQHLVAQNRELTVKNGDTEYKNEDLKKQNEELDDHAQELESLLVEMTEENDQLSKENESLTEEFSNLKQELEVARMIAIPTDESKEEENQRIKSLVAENITLKAATCALKEQTRNMEALQANTVNESQQARRELESRITTLNAKQGDLIKEVQDLEYRVKRHEKEAEELLEAKRTSEKEAEEKLKTTQKEYDTEKKQLEHRVLSLESTRNYEKKVSEKKLTEAKDALGSKIKTLHDQLLKVKEQAANLLVVESDRDRLQRDFDDLKASYSTLRASDEKEALENRVNVPSVSEEEEQEKAKLQGLIQDLEGEISSANTEKGALNKKVQDLEDRIKRHEKEAEELSEAKRTSEKEAEEKLKTTQKEYDTEKKQLEHRVLSLESTRNHEKKASEKKLTEAKDALGSKIKTLHDQLLKVKEQAANLLVVESDRDRLQHDFDDLKASYSTLREEKEALEQRLNLADIASVDQEQMNALQSTCDKLRLELSREKTAHLATVRDCGEAKRKNNDMKIQKDAKDQQVKMLKEQLDKAAGRCQEVARLAKSLDEKNQEIQILECKLAEVQKRNDKGKQREGPVDKSSDADSSNTQNGTQNDAESLRRQLLEELTKRSAALDPGSFIRTVRNAGRTLQAVDVQRELALAKERRPQYKLNDRIKTSAPPLPSRPASKPWDNIKPSPYLRNTRNRGNDSGNDADESDQDEDEDEDEEDNDGIESDDSRLFQKYSKMGAQPRAKNLSLARKEVNNLGRCAILEALPEKYVTQIWAREAVTPERLAQFRQDPERYGPKTRNTHIDKTGSTTEDLRNSNWNQALVYRLASLLDDIVAQCPDKSRFGGKIIWKDLVQNRFDKIYIDIIAALPKDEAEKNSSALVAARMETQRFKRNVVNGVTTIRHAKYRARMNISAIMIGYSKERRDKDATEFWTYVLNVTHILGHIGMSDEESGAEEIETPSGLKQTRRTKQVLVLPWRHPSFRELFTHVDRVPQLEEMIFQQTGRHVRLPRIRIEREAKRRSKPKKLHRSFFREGYLDKLMEHEVVKLDLADGDFPLHAFQFDNFIYGDGNGDGVPGSI